jgi:L-threonylcarbamoyladenylate synthase
MFFEKLVATMTTGTKILKVNAISDLKIAKDYLLSKQVVAIPTETVYGLAANALDSDSVAQIYSVKNRPQDNPLIVHVNSLEMVRSLVKNGEIPPVYNTLIENFWPGPLTLLFEKAPGVIPDNVTCGLSTVAIRMPVHNVARDLIEYCGFPLAAPSANTSGRPSPTRAEHVLNDLDGKIPLIIDGGECQSGVESTVIDGLGEIPVILRPGGITVEMIRKVIGNIRVYKKNEDAKLEECPTTPGMKYKHYSPKAKVILVQDSLKLEEYANDYFKKGLRVGCLLRKDSDVVLKCDNVLFFYMGSSLDSVAHELFNGLRTLDENGVDVILVPSVEEEHEGLAIMNRLTKASSQVI